jgi:hypothetical protein
MRIGGLGLGRRVTHAAALAKILGLSLSLSHTLTGMTAGCIFSGDQQQPRGLADEWSTESPPAPNICNNQNQLCNEQHNALGWMFGILFIRAASEQRDGSPPNQFAPRAHQAKEFGRYIVFSSSSFDTARIKIIICAHTNSLCALRERHTPPTRAAFPKRAL